MVTTDEEKREYVMENVIIRHSEQADIDGVKAIYESEVAYGGTLQLPFPSLDVGHHDYQTSHKVAIAWLLNTMVKLSVN